MIDIKDVFIIIIVIIHIKDVFIIIITKIQEQPIYKDLSINI